MKDDLKADTWNTFFKSDDVNLITDSFIDILSNIEKNTKEVKLLLKNKCKNHGLLLQSIDYKNHLNKSLQLYP